MRRNLKAGKRYGRGLDFRVLSEEEINDIHSATLEVLWKTGVFVEDEEALEIFDGGGAFVDRKTKIVKIPPHLVVDAVQSAPEIVLMAGRDPRNDFLCEPNRVGFDCFGEAILVVDPQTRERREPTRVDLAESMRLIDALENIDVVHRAMGCHDVSPEVVSLYNAEAMLSNTSKHVICAAGNGFLMRKIIQMLIAVVGSKEKLMERPILTSGTCTITPLRIPRDCSEIIIESARAGLLAKPLAQAMAGGSSPVTLAGTLVVHNSEILSVCVLSQLVRKGAPFMYGSSSCTMDLRFGTSVVGSPETALLNAAVAQIARYYLLPAQVAGG
jgi:trimethylamine--corrinoid protein Co-methyltransferase